jgi:hypothetical protein
MRKTPTPMDAASLAWKAWQLQAQSAAVISMRIAGMAGMWAMPPSEWVRMVTEKQAAFAEAGQKMMLAAMTGAAPHRVAGRGISPLSRRTKANVRRLSGAVRRG